MLSMICAQAFAAAYSSQEAKQCVCPLADDFLKCDISTYWNSYDESSTDTCSNMEKSCDMTPSEKPSQKTISCILVMRCP